MSVIYIWPSLITRSWANKSRKVDKIKKSIHYVTWQLLRGVFLKNVMILFFPFSCLLRKTSTWLYIVRLFENVFFSDVTMQRSKDAEILMNSKHNLFDGFTRRGFGAFRCPNLVKRHNSGIVKWIIGWHCKLEARSAIILNILSSLFKIINFQRQ